MQPSALQSGRNCLGLAQRRLQGNLGAQRPMNRHQEVFANELVQLEIVHVAACADLWCVHDDEHMVRINMESWNVVAVSAFGDRHRMKVKLACEHRLGVVAPFRNVEPEESVGALLQGRQLSQVAAAHACGVDPAQLHGETSFHVVVSTPRRHRYLLPQCAPDGGGPAVRSASLCCGSPPMGALPVPDLATSEL